MRNQDMEKTDNAEHRQQNLNSIIKLQQTSQVANQIPADELVYDQHQLDLNEAAGSLFIMQPSTKQAITLGKTPQVPITPNTTENQIKLQQASTLLNYQQRAPIRHIHAKTTLPSGSATISVQSNSPASKQSRPQMPLAANLGSDRFTMNSIQRSSPSIGQQPVFHQKNATQTKIAQKLAIAQQERANSRKAVASRKSKPQGGAASGTLLQDMGHNRKSSQYSKKDLTISLPKTINVNMQSQKKQTKLQAQSPLHMSIATNVDKPTINPELVAEEAQQLSPMSGKKLGEKASVTPRAEKAKRQKFTSEATKALSNLRSCRSMRGPSQGIVNNASQSGIKSSKKQKTPVKNLSQARSRLISKAAGEGGQKYRFSTGFFDLERSSVHSRQSNFNATQSATHKNINDQLIAGLEQQFNKTGEFPKHTAAIARKQQTETPKKEQERTSSSGLDTLRGGQNPLIFSMNFEQSKEALGSALLGQKTISDVDARSFKASISNNSGGLVSGTNSFKKAKLSQHQTMFVDVKQKKDLEGGGSKHLRRQSNVTQVMNQNIESTIPNAFHIKRGSQYNMSSPQQQYDKMSQIRSNQKEQQHNNFTRITTKLRTGNGPKTFETSSRTSNAPSYKKKSNPSFIKLQDNANIPNNHKPELAPNLKTIQKRKTFGSSHAVTSGTKKNPLGSRQQPIRQSTTQMLDVLTPFNPVDDLPIVGRSSERKFMGMHLEKGTASRSIYESLPVQNSQESMDLNNFNAIINRTECPNDEEDLCRIAAQSSETNQILSNTEKPSNDEKANTQQMSQGNEIQDSPLTIRQRMQPPASALTQQLTPLIKESKAESAANLYMVKLQQLQMGSSEQTANNTKEALDTGHQFINGLSESIAGSAGYDNYGLSQGISLKPCSVIEATEKTIDQESIINNVTNQEAYFLSMVDVEEVNPRIFQNDHVNQHNSGSSWSQADQDECDFTQIEEFAPTDTKIQVAKSKIEPKFKIINFLSPRPNLRFSILVGQQKVSPTNEGRDDPESKKRIQHGKRPSKLTFHSDEVKQSKPPKHRKKNTSARGLQPSSSTKYVDYQVKLQTGGKSGNVGCPTQKIFKNNKILDSNSKSIINNIMHKDPLTPNDGMSDLMMEHEARKQIKQQAAKQKRLPIGQQSASHTILDSIQMSLSLEMQEMSEHTKSSNLKQVYQTNALKKTASLHSLNEHLEQNNVTIDACKESQPTVVLDVIDTIEEMPSNRQGETDITAAQLPQSCQLVTEEEKEEFVGITKTPTTLAEQQFMSEQFTQGKLTKNTISQEESKQKSSHNTLPIQEVSDGAMAIQGNLVKEIEEIKKEHLIQTLQSLQYISTCEKPAKAQIILKSFNMPNQKNPVCETGVQSPDGKGRHSTVASNSTNLSQSNKGNTVSAKHPAVYHFTKRQKQFSGLPPQGAGPAKREQRRTLLFDLDETLIHCVDDCTDPSTYQHLIEIKVAPNKPQSTSNVSKSTSQKPFHLHSSSSTHSRSSGMIKSSSGSKMRRQTVSTSQASVHLSKSQSKSQSQNNAVEESADQQSCVKAGINIRPHAVECLRECEQMGFEVAIFTASHQSYADAVLDKLIDPERRYPRLYRQHCIRTNEGIYIKDLRVIRNRQLKDIILVDNAVYSFGLQLTNGIPILPFYRDQQDHELVQLVAYLRNHVLKAKSVQQVNAAQFKLPHLAKQDLKQLIQHAESI